MGSTMVNAALFGTSIKDEGDFVKQKEANPRMYQRGQNFEIQTQMDDVRKKFENTDQWMKAPDGTGTQLTEEQWLYAHTEAFKEKYGDWR